MIKYIKKGDRKPYLRATLSYVQNGGTITPIDLTGSTVKFVMSISGASPKINQILAGEEILDAEAGEVQYKWRDGDTDTTGTYLAEFEITEVSGEKITVWDLRTAAQIQDGIYPEPLYIEIVEDLD